MEVDMNDTTDSTGSKDDAVQDIMQAILRPDTAMTFELLDTWKDHLTKTDLAKCLLLSTYKDCPELAMYLVNLGVDVMEEVYLDISLTFRKRLLVNYCVEKWVSTILEEKNGKDEPSSKNCAVLTSIGYVLSVTKDISSIDDDSSDDDIMSATCRGTTVRPLEYMIIIEKTSILKAICNSPLDEDIGSQALVYACHNRSEKIFQILIAQPNIREMVNTMSTWARLPLVEAGEYSPHFIKDLIAKGADVSAFVPAMPWSCLSYLVSGFCCAEDTLDIVKHLVTRGADLLKPQPVLHQCDLFRVMRKATDTLMDHDEGGMDAANRLEFSARLKQVYRLNEYLTDHTANSNIQAQALLLNIMFFHRITNHSRYKRTIFATTSQMVICHWQHINCLLAKNVVNIPEFEASFDNELEALCKKHQTGYSSVPDGINLKEGIQDGSLVDVLLIAVREAWIYPMVSESDFVLSLADHCSQAMSLLATLGSRMRRNGARAFNSLLYYGGVDFMSLLCSYLDVLELHEMKSCIDMLREEEIVNEEELEDEEEEEEEDEEEEEQEEEKQEEDKEKEEAGEEKQSEEDKEEEENQEEDQEEDDEGQKENYLMEVLTAYESTPRPLMALARVQILKYLGVINIVSQVESLDLPYPLKLYLLPFITDRCFSKNGSDFKFDYMLCH